MELDPEITSLIVIDMQNDFCHPQGKLYVAGSERIVPRIKQLMQRAIRSGAKLAFTQDWHHPSDSEFKIWPQHCIENSWGAEIIPDLDFPGYRIRKRRYSGFHATDLDLWLRENGIRNIILSGVCTNICVLHTASDAVLLGYRVILAKDCVASISDYDHQYGIYHLSKILRVELVDSEEIEFGKS